MTNNDSTRFPRDISVLVVAACAPTSEPFLGQVGIVLGFVHDLEPAAPRDSTVRVLFPSGQDWDFDPSELTPEEQS